MDRVVVVGAVLAALLATSAAFQWTTRPEPRPADLAPVQDAAAIAVRQELGLRIAATAVTSLDDERAEAMVLGDGEAAPSGQVRVTLERRPDGWRSTAVEVVE